MKKRPRSVSNIFLVILLMFCPTIDSKAGQLPHFNDLAANVDPHSGSVNFSMPLEVPPGRQGIQPNLQLQYNSNAPGGILGHGWAMELGAIQITAKQGVPKYNGSDKYYLLQAGISEDIVFDPSAGFYRTKSEGSFMKIEKVSDNWRITDKQGTRYYFGEQNSSREFDPNSSTRIYKWFLNRVEDIHGNYMLITYHRDRDKLYPLRIDYTGHGPSAQSPFASVEFELEDRPDIALSYLSGFKIETSKRIKNITMSVNGALQRRYELSYEQSALTNRSTLSDITMVGSDNTSSLPALSFTYINQTPASFTETASNIIPSHLGITEGGGEDNGVRLADVNGDGLIDILWADGSGSSQYQTWLNNGTGFSQSSNWLIPVIENGGLSDFSMRLVDVSGDGLVDLVYSKGTSMSYHRTFINNGTRFVETSNWVLPSDMGFSEATISGDNSVRFADLNADGLMDVVWADGPSSTQRKTYLNNGTTFVQTSKWIVPSALGFNESDWNDNGVRFADVNGDGLADLVWADGSDSSQYQTWLNNGSDFVQTSNWIVPLVQNGLSNPTIVLSDFNGDGLADVIWADGTNMAQHKAFINNGKNFVASANWVVPQSAGFTEEGSASSNGVQLVDINGDGMTDVIQADGVDMAQHRTYLNTSFMPDLMVSVDNGIGGKTIFTYDVSTKYQNTLLPLVAAVVKSSMVSNSMGDSYTTAYDYADGLWLGGLTRDFRGFGLVKLTDADGNYVQKEFLQEDIYKGRQLWESTFDQDNRLFSKIAYTWDNSLIAAGINFVFLKRKDNMIFDGNATGRRTAEVTYFEGTPQFGNLTKAVQLGEVDLASGNDIGSDSRIVEMSYVNNADQWIIGLPAQTSIKDHAGNQIRKAWFYYDGQSNTSSPSKGLLTKKEDWKGLAEGDPANPRTQYNYDAYGNLLNTVDPMNNSTAIAYDVDYHMFPLITQNALAHQVVNKYYGINGESLDDGVGLSGLWGQLKATTDPNNNEGKRTYDVFGRLLSSISSLDSVVKPTTRIEYILTSNYAMTRTSQRVNHGQDQVISATSFSDGLGRLIQTKTPAGYSGQFVVQNQKEYNARGLSEKQYHPYFTFNGLDVLDPIDSSKPASQTLYDAMGRLLQTTNPDGSSATVNYDDWTLRSVNENGHKQESDFDAYGRLIEKREYTGSDGRAAVYYPASAFSFYAKTNYIYDSEGNLIQTRDALNNQTTIEYDKLGRKIAMNDPDMGAWAYAYDLNGNLTSQTDAKGQVVNFNYDDLNRLVNKIGPSGLNVVYTYDELAFPHSKGRLSKVDYGINNKALFQNDAIGRETSSTKIIDAQSFGVERNYNALNNLIQIEYPDEKNIYYDYNDAGQIEAISNDPALFDQQSYLIKSSVFLRLIDLIEHYVFGVTPAYAAPSIAAPSNLTATAASSSQINLAWTDNCPNETGFKIERGNGAASSTWTQIATVGANVRNFSNTGLASAVTYSYRVRAYKSSTHSTYSNTATATTLMPAPATPTGLTTTAISSSQINLAWTDNSANEAGFKIERGSGSAPSAWTQIATVGANVKNYSNTGLSADTTYSYRVRAYNSGGNSSYSNNSSVATTALAMLFVKSVDYNATGQIRRLEYGNGDIIVQEYDPLTLRLARKYTVSGQGQVIQDLNYTYDPAGNIIRIDDHINTATQDFQYDALGRLVQASGNYGTKNFVYDAIGNIIEKDGKTYAYGAGSAGPHAVTSLSDNTIFTYDANGNMATKQAGGELTEYIYDVENRLMQVKKNGVSLASYSYDGDGGRTKKITAQGVTRYVGLFYEERLGIASDHIFFGDLRVASLSIGKVLYFHSDHLGGANVLTDASGVKKELIEYMPFGSMKRHEKYGSNFDVAHFYFTSKELDEEAGLYFYGARYYDPSIGRFITPDIKIAFPENPQAFNRFSYVHNNPLNFTDPTGHFAWLIPAVISAIKGSLIGATIGAGLAAITGSNIGQGAMLGAVSGSFFGGTGGAMGHLAKQGINLSTGLKILAYAESGAYAGAAGAAILGSNPLRGAGFGAISGIVFGGLGKLGGINSFWDGARIPLTGIAGGAISELCGGKFIDGFIFASSIAGADFIYRAILRSQGADRGASMRTATKDAQPKLDENGNLINNKSLHADLDVSQPGVPSNPAGIKVGFWDKFFAGETSPAMNFTGKYVPGIQGLSLAHDITSHYLANTVGGRINGLLFNFQTMPPVYGLNFVGSAINDNSSFIGIYMANKQDRN